MERRSRLFEGVGEYDMTDEELTTTLNRLLAYREQTLSGITDNPRSAHCPSPPRLLGNVLTPGEKTHVDGCEFCQSILAGRSAR